MSDTPELPVIDGKFNTWDRSPFVRLSDAQAALQQAERAQPSEGA